tara:strand:- start:500 stop:730 length:231 start_codon:yes stop_codon:yes gene_type:complete
MEISMVRRRKSIGELISSVVFFGVAVWALTQGKSLFNEGQYAKCFFVYLGGLLSLLAAFRFQIQDLLIWIKSRNGN